MKRQTVSVVLVALVVILGCPKKRPPAVLTDPSQRSSPGAYPPATATPEPEQPVAEGPDIAAIPAGNPSGEDFSVNDASGENGPLEDIRFDYDRAEISDAARATLEKHALWLQNHRTAKVTIEGTATNAGPSTTTSPSATSARAPCATTWPAWGVAGDRMHTVSLGKERPLDPASNDQAFAKNRRAHFVVSR
jgi:peptidoglycan-associated lipoprotein